MYEKKILITLNSAKKYCLATEEPAVAADKLDILTIFITLV